MSKFAEYKTVITDAKCLKKVLQTRFKEVELHDTPQDLIDYQGHKTHYLDKEGDKAEVIVRRKYVGGAANDIGFAKGADGTFKAIISQYDSGKHNAKWLEQLNKDYLVERAKSIMEEQDGELFETETLGDGSIRLQFRVGVTA